MVERTRGSIPEPEPWDREPDAALLACGELGPFMKTGRPRFEFGQMHPDLQEILVRMDREEIALFNQGVKIITSLDKKDLERFKLSLKVFGVFIAIWRGIKWATLSFLAGLAAVSLAGDQLVKIGGWFLKVLKFIQNGSGQ